MDKFTVIESVIQKHGARAFFEATFEGRGCDYAPLEAMGFAPTLEDAGRVPYVACIAYIAYHRMSAEGGCFSIIDRSRARGNAHSLLSTRACEPCVYPALVSIPLTWSPKKSPGSMKRRT